jgi:hypothetical protein
LIGRDEIGVKIADAAWPSAFHNRVVKFNNADGRGGALLDAEPRGPQEFLAVVFVPRDLEAIAFTQEITDVPPDIGWLRRCIVLGTEKLIEVRIAIKRRRLFRGIDHVRALEKGAV